MNRFFYVWAIKRNVIEKYENRLGKKELGSRDSERNVWGG